MRPGRGTCLAALAIVCAAVLALAGVALAERTIGLSSGTVELALAPGQQANDSLIVYNTGDEPFKALLYTSDVIYDEEGIPSYERPTGAAGEFLTSPASWIRLRVPDTTKIVANTPYIEMEPGQEFTVDYEIVVPSNAPPGDYNAIVFFEMFEFTDEGETNISRISGRIGARVHVRVVGAIQDDLRVGPFAIRTFVLGDSVLYTLDVENAGNVDKTYRASIEILDASGAVRDQALVASETVVYAQNIREHTGTIELQEATLGKFTARAVVDYERETGDEAGTRVPETLTFERTMWVVPVWLAIAAVALVGGLAIWLSWRQAKRAAARSVEREAGSGTRGARRRGGRARRRERDPGPPEDAEPESVEETPVEPLEDEPVADRRADPVQDSDSWVPDDLFE
jgi:hypothetical protein